jgi:hypothetical protein
VPRAAAGRWTPAGVAGRIAGRHAVSIVSRAVPDLTDSEARTAGESVRSGIEEMPDLLRAGFVFALMAAFAGTACRLFVVSEVERFSRGLALAAVFDSRARTDR